MAGALALGGLAISGSSPAGAALPDWAPGQRIGGQDRYETAVLVALDYSDDPDNLIIASGENPSDALAASSLAGQELAPVILVKSDSVPDIVNEYLDEISDFDGTVYIVGGESAVSADVEDEIADALGDADDVVRIAGADRFATAAEINDEVFDSGDSVIIVNGSNGRWPDALSAGPLAAYEGWPIIVTGDGGLNDAAADQIDDFLTVDEDTSFILVGGTSVLPSSVEDDLLALDVHQEHITRIGGSNRYGTNLLVNAWMYENATFDDGGATYKFDLPVIGDGDTGRGITLVSGEAPWDSLSASVWTVGGTPYHLVMTRPDSLPAETSVLISTLANFGGPTDAYVIGGRSAVSDAVRIAAYDAANTDVDGPAIAGCFAGSDQLTLDFSGLDPNSKGVALLGVANQTINVDNYEMTINGGDDDAVLVDEEPDAGEVALNADISELAFYPELHHVTFYLTTDDGGDEVPYQLQEGDTFDFLGYENSQVVGDASCEVAADDDGPTLTVTASDNYVYVTADEPVSPDLGELTISDTGGTLDWGIPVPGSYEFVGAGGIEAGATSCVTYILSGGLAGDFGSCGANKSWVIPMDDPIVATRITVGVDSFADANGNTNEAEVRGSVAEDTTAPGITALTTACVNTASAAWEIDDLDITYNNYLAEDGASYTGPVGNDWTVEVVNERGLDRATVEVNAADKEMVITVDENWHTVGDIRAAARAAGLGGILGSWTFEGDGTVADTGGGLEPDDAGTKDCTTYFSFSENAYADDSAIDVSFAGRAVTPDWILGDLDGLFPLKLALMKIEDIDTTDTDVVLQFEADGLVDSEGNDRSTRYSYDI